MIESALRPAFQHIFVRPLMHATYKYLHPNVVMLLSLFIGLLSAIALTLHLLLIAALLLLLSGYLDMLDGSIARMRNSSTALGTILDILSDRLVESFIVIALFIRDPQLALICLLMMMSMLLCVSSFLLVGIFSKQKGQKSFYYSPGLMERAEAFLFFIAMIFLPNIDVLLGSLFILLVLWTTLYRVYEFYGQDKGLPCTF